MGLGAGHVMDMINRMKQNRSQRPSQRAKFRENNREIIYASNNDRKQTRFITVSENQLDTIKQAIRARAKTQSRKEQYIYIFSFLIGLFVIGLIMRWIN